MERGLQLWDLTNRQSGMVRKVRRRENEPIRLSGALLNVRSALLASAGLLTIVALQKRYIQPHSITHMKMDDNLPLQ